MTLSGLSHVAAQVRHKVLGEVVVLEPQNDENPH